MSNLDINHYSTEAEKVLKENSPIVLKGVYIKAAKAKQKPSLKQLGAWKKARFVDFGQSKILIRVFNNEDEELEVHSLAITFLKDNEETLFSWGTTEEPLVKLPPKGNAMLVFAPRTPYLRLIRR